MKVTKTQSALSNLVIQEEAARQRQRRSVSNSGQGKFNIAMKMNEADNPYISG